MDKVTMTLNGTTPLLMHNDALADPLSPATKAMKALTGKRTKTDEDHDAIAKMEWMAGLYIERGKIVLPGSNIYASMIEGARLTKSGKKVERGITMGGASFDLIYSGPTDLEEMYAKEVFTDRRTVKVGQTKVMRVRPIFRDWSAEVDLYMDTAVLDLADLTALARDAGTMVGIGDHRARGGYGRFTATVTAA